MIDKLTPEQKAQIEIYRKRFFDAAVSINTDRERAAKAALELAEIAGLKDGKVTHVATPEVGEVLSDSLWDSLSDSLRDSLRDSLSDSLWASLLDSLRDSLWDSLWDSLRDSLRASLWTPLFASLWNSLWDSGWTAFYSYAVEQLGVECSAEHRRILELYRVLFESCSAVWFAPNAVIICDKPTSTTVKYDKLVNIKWGEE